MPETNYEKGSASSGRAREIGQRTKDDASELARRGRDRAAGELDLVADALRDMRGRLDAQGSMFGSYAEKAAEQIERAAGLARRRDPQEALEAVERFARRDTALFLGGALSLGFFVARFLRSSSHASGEESVPQERAYETDIDLDVGEFPSSGTVADTPGAGAR